MRPKDTRSCFIGLRGLVAAALAMLTAACPTPDGPPAAQPTPAPATAAAVIRPSDIRLSDVAAQAGLVHPVICGAPDKPYLIDTNGTGAAVIDYDGDGWMDLYIGNGATLQEWAEGPYPNLLYHNLGDGTFEEVAEKMGVADRAWCSGALAWDYDNDGDSDLSVSNYGPNRLYRNDGGHFTDVAAAAGLVAEGWSMGMAAADYDSDGDLDLFIAHYFFFDLDNPEGNTAQGGDRVCQWKGADVACGPIGFVPEPDRLYRNDGDGTFSDVSEEAGILDAEPGFGMGVLWIDADEDGLLDIYVANDASPNLLYRNLGNGRFAETGDWSGLALGGSAIPQSGMGVTAGDIDGDGREEIFVSNYSHQSNALYVPAGSGMFDDLSALAGLADISFRYLGWGASFFDVENDGDLDLLVANGHVYPEVDEVDPSTSYQQRDLLFVNNGNGVFETWIPPSDCPLTRQTSSRGLVRIDFDNDGDSDILVVALDGPAMLLENRSDTGSWLGISLRGVSGNRQAPGSRVRVVCGDLEQVQVGRLGSSYMSNEDPRLLFGLGPASEASVEVTWPDGTVELWPSLTSQRYHLLVQGGGAAPGSASAQDSPATQEGGAAAVPAEEQEEQP